MKHSECYTNFAFNTSSPLTRKSEQKFIADGRLTDKYHVTYLPLHKRKPPEKCIKSLAAYEYTRNGLDLDSGGSDQINSEYSYKRKEHTPVLNLIHLLGKKGIRSSHLNKPCSCCNHCSHCSITKRHLSACQHCVRQLNAENCIKTRRKRFGSKICAAIKGIRSNPKNVCSAPCFPCLCTTLLRHSSKALATSGLNKPCSRSAIGYFRNCSPHQQNIIATKKGIATSKVNRSSLKNEIQCNLSNKMQEKYLAGLKPKTDKTHLHLSSFNTGTFVCIPSECNLYSSKQKVKDSCTWQTEQDQKLRSSTNIFKTPVLGVNSQNTTSTFESTIPNNERKKKCIHGKSTYIDKICSNSNLKNVSFMRNCLPNLSLSNKNSSMKKNTRRPLNFNSEVIDKALLKPLKNYTRNELYSVNQSKLNGMRQIQKNSYPSLEKCIFCHKGRIPLFHVYRSQVYVPKQCNFSKCRKRIKLRYMQHKTEFSDPSFKRLSSSEAPKRISFKRSFEIENKRIINKQNRKLRNFFKDSSQSKKLSNNSTVSKASKTKKNKICVNSLVKKCSSNHHKYKKNRNTQLGPNCYMANAGTNSLLELFKPDHKSTKVVGKARNIDRHTKMCKCTSIYRVPDTCDSYFCFKKNKRNRFRNKYVSTVQEKRKSKKSMTSIYCKSKSTQSRDKINEKRVRSECDYWPSLQTVWIRSNICFGTDFRKVLSTLDIRAEDPLEKYQTVSDVTYSRRRNQNDRKRYGSEYRTLHVNNADKAIDRPSSYSNSLFKKLIRRNKMKIRYYPKNVQKYDLQSTCPHDAIDNNSYSKPEKDYALKCKIKATNRNSECKIGGQHNSNNKLGKYALSKRRHTGTQKHDLTGSTSFVTKSAYNLKNSQKSKHIVENYYEVRDSVSDNRRKVSDAMYALGDYIYEPDFCVPYKYNRDKSVKRNRNRLQFPKESKPITHKSKTVGCIAKGSFRKLKVVTNKHAQTDYSKDLKVYRGPKGITRFLSSCHTRSEVINPPKQEARLSINNAPQYKCYVRHNVGTKTSKFNHKKYGSKNACPLEDITVGKHKSNRNVSKKINWHNTYNNDVYSKPEIVKSSKKQCKLVNNHHHTSQVSNKYDSRGRRKNCHSNFLSLSGDSYKLHKLLNIRTNRSTRIARSQTVPKMPVELEKIVRNSQNRRVYTVGSNINFSIQFYKEDSLNLDHIESNPKTGSSLSSVLHSISSPPRKGLIKKLGSLYTPKVINKTKNTRLLDEDTKTSNKFVKQETDQRIPNSNHEFIENQKVLRNLRNASNNKTKSNRRVNLRLHTHDKNIMKQISKNKTPNKHFSKGNKIASQNKDYKSISYHRSIGCPEDFANTPIVNSKTSTKQEFTNDMTDDQNQFSDRKSNIVTLKRPKRKLTFLKAISEKSKFLKRRNRENNKQGIIYTNRESSKQSHNCKNENSKQTGTLAVKLVTRYDKSTLTKLKQVSKHDYECEPHVCIPGICDPSICYKIYKSKNKNVKDMSILAKKEAKSKSVGTYPYKHDIAKRCFCILSNKNVKNIKKPDNNTDYGIKSINHSYTIHKETPNKKLALTIPYEKINKRSKGNKLICKYFAKLGLANKEKESEITLTRKAAVYKRLNKSNENKLYNAHIKTKQDLIHSYGNMVTLMPYSKKKFKKSTSRMTILNFYEFKNEELFADTSNVPISYENMTNTEQYATPSEIRRGQSYRSKYKKRSKQNIPKSEKKITTATGCLLSLGISKKYTFEKKRKQHATSSEIRHSYRGRFKNKYSKKRDFPSSELSLSQPEGKYDKKSKPNVPNKMKKQDTPAKELPISHSKRDKYRSIKKQNDTARESVLKHQNRSKYKKINKQNNNKEPGPEIAVSNLIRQRKNKKKDILATKATINFPNREKYKKRNANSVASSEILLSPPKKDIHKQRNKKYVPPGDKNISLSIEILNKDKLKKKTQKDILVRDLASSNENSKSHHDNMDTYRVLYHAPVDAKSPYTPVLSKCVQHLNSVAKYIKTAIFNGSLGFSKHKRTGRLSDHYRHLRADNTELNTQQKLSKGHTLEKIATQDTCPICKRPHSLKQAEDKYLNTQPATIGRKIYRTDNSIRYKSVSDATRSTHPQELNKTKRYRLTDLPKKSRNKSKSPSKHLQPTKFENGKQNILETINTTSHTPEVFVPHVKRSENVKISKSYPCYDRCHQQRELGIPRLKLIPGFFKCLFRKKNKPVLPKQDCPICIKNNLPGVPPAHIATKKYFLFGSYLWSILSKGKIRKQKRMKTGTKKLSDKPSPSFEMVVDADTMKVTNKDEIYRNLRDNLHTGTNKQGLKLSQINRVLPPAIDLVMERDNGVLLNGDTLLRVSDINYKKNTNKGLTQKRQTLTMSHLMAEKAAIKYKVGKGDQPESHDYCTCCICSNDSYLRRQNQPQNCTCCICRYGCHYGVKFRQQKRKIETRYDTTKKGVKLKEVQKGKGNTLFATASDKSSPVRSKVTKVSGLVTSFVSDVESIISQLRVNPCYCGLQICKKETKKLEELRRSGLKANAPPECVCGSEICKLQYTKQTPYYKEKEKRKKKKATEKKKRQNRLKQQTKARLKQYSKENASLRKKIKRRDKKAIKIIKKYEDGTSSWVMLAENVADMGRLGINTFYRMITRVKRVIFHPNDIKYIAKQAYSDPKGTAAKSLQDFRDSGYNGTLTRVRYRCASMQTSKYLVSAMERHPVTNYLFHFRDKDPKQRFKSIKAKKEKPDLECNTFLTSLRKKPCLWLYRLCPWFYPHCLGLLAFWRQFTDVILFLLAVAVWSPCILCMEFCRTVMCCFMCAGGG